MVNVSALLLLAGLLTAGATRAQSFSTVNKHLAAVSGKLQCKVQQYDGTKLLSEHIATQEQPQLPDGWVVDVDAEPVKGVSGAIEIKARFRLTSGTVSSTALSISFNFENWSAENYVMVPAIVYNGNRYPSIGNGYNPDYAESMYYNKQVPLTISNNPRLEWNSDRPSLLQLETTNTATPAVCFFSPRYQKSFMVFTDQQSVHGNHGLTISEDAQKTTSAMSITAPAMRERATGFGDFHPSGDKAPNWAAGDELIIRCRMLVQPATGIPDLLTTFLTQRKQFLAKNNPRNLLPMSHLTKLFTNITSNNFRRLPVGSYYLPENNEDFQLGWVSGMINTYPMLALNDAKERDRVAQELNFVVHKLQAESGYFFGGITSAGQIRPEKMHPAFPEPQAMVRKNADVLFWLVKHLELFTAQGYQSSIQKSWEDAAAKLAHAFARTWQQEGEFGQYIAPATGKIAVYNSTAGAMVPAGLALAAAYFKKPEWLKVAQEAAAYYYERDVVKQGLTGGDCGDISMDANSESAFGFLESLMTLYSHTGDRAWLNKAEVQAALCATWTISYDVKFPENSQIGKLKSNMAGAVWASIQNKHAAPGICTSSGDYLFKLFRATGNPIYADLIRDIQHAHAEAVNLPPGHITTGLMPGSSMERIQPSDAEGRGSIGNYVNSRNSWTETNGALMALELPGIYVQSDKNLVQVFDHVSVQLVKVGRQERRLVISNETRFDADVSVFIETSKEAKNPLATTAFANWHKVNVPATSTVTLVVSKNGITYQ